MNVQARAAQPIAFTSLGSADVARNLAVEGHATASAIETEWRLLEATGIGTVFQRFDWVDSYARHVAPHEGLEPAFLLGRLDGHPAFVLPLGIERIGPLRIARWLGGSHSGYNFGLWSREAADMLPRLGRAGIVDMLRRALPDVDGAVLERIPFEHDGVGQPLAAIPLLRSPVEGYSVSLDGGMDAVIARTGGKARRRRARSKERRMAQFGNVEHGIITDIEEAHAALDFFAEQKAMRLAEQGLPNVFGRPGVMHFLNDLLDRSVGQREPLLQITGYRVAGKLRAVVGSGVHNGRVNVYILTLIHDETLPHSPGQVLMYRHVEECCERGYRHFDFGVGYELYKESWADTRHALFDGYLSFTAKGAAFIGAIKLREQGKLLLRRNARLWKLLKALRNRDVARAEEKDPHED